MRKSISWASALTLAIILAACQPAVTPVSQNDGNAISTDISTATTWQSGTTYRIASAISLSSDLTIQPGATVLFDAGASLTVLSGASLSAIGEASSRIVFSSSSAHPAAGQWGGIRLDSGAVLNTFDYCDIKFAGSDDGNPAIGFHDVGLYGGVSAKADIENCVISNNLGMGVDASWAASPTTFEGNFFYANSGIPVAINAHVLFDATNHFYAPGGAISGAEKNNCVELAGAISVPCSLVVTEVPYYFPAGFDVSSGLTISKGVALKMGSGASMSVLSTGFLNAVGDAANPIVFTSFADKATLGDSNGLASTGAAGQWGRILFDSGSVSASNVMTYCTVKYAGYDGGIGQNVYAVEFYDWGLYGGTAARASLSYLSVHDDLQGGIVASTAGSGTSITHCGFFANGADGSTIFDLDRNGNALVTQSNNVGDFIRN